MCWQSQRVQPQVGGTAVAGGSFVDVLGGFDIVEDVRMSFATKHKFEKMGLSEGKVYLLRLIMILAHLLFSISDRTWNRMDERTG
jgi:hypothetical protein